MSICPADNSTQFTTESPLWTNGQTFHQLGLEIALGFGGIATIISLLLVILHGTHYSNPTEQKHIIRILMMIPVYACISFASFYDYKHATYWQTIRDCYEAFAIASFFALLCHYIAPNLHEQKNYFRTITPKNWFWGVFGLQYLTGGQNRGPLRRPKSGLTWFNVVWVGIFQYCFIRVTCTIVALVTQLLGRYCEHSFNPKFGHFWYQFLTAVSVTIAMFCVIQFYIQTKDDLAARKPFLKVLCIKLVIFFSFWQTLVISALASQYGPLKPGPKVNSPDIYIGIPAVLIDFEMAFFAVMHIFAFSWRPYSLRGQDKYATNPPDTIVELTPPRYHGGFLGILAYLDAANPWDVIKASARGFRWLFVGYRRRREDISYQEAGKPTDDVLSPAYTASPHAATELRPSSDRTPRPGYGDFEDDRTRLLHSGLGRTPTRDASPYSTYHEQDYGKQDFQASAEEEFDLSNPGAYRPSTANNADTSYHGAQNVVRPSTNAPPQEVHVHDPNWNMFGGAPESPPDQRRQHGQPVLYDHNYPPRF